MSIILIGWRGSCQSRSELWMGTTDWKMPQQCLYGICRKVPLLSLPVKENITSLGWGPPAKHIFKPFACVNALTLTTDWRGVCGWGSRAVERRKDFLQMMQKERGHPGPKAVRVHSLCCRIPRRKGAFSYHDFVWTCLQRFFS